MYKFCLFFLVVFTAVIPVAIGQQASSRFVLTGKVDIDTGTATLYPLNAADYYPGHQDRLKTTIKDGQFVFSDTSLYPCVFRIIIQGGANQSYISDFFLVDPGSQQVDCHLAAARELLTPTNQSMEEYNTRIRKLFVPTTVALDQLSDKYKKLKDPVTHELSDQLTDQYWTAWDSLNAIKNDRLLQYIRQYPGSYVAMWEVVKRFQSGYDPALTKMYHALSPAIRQTHTGRLLGEKLASAEVTAVGAAFPVLTLTDNRSRTVKIPLPPAAANKYTLVDFWYSHCSACIGQFDALKKVYEKYGHKGFAIAGVSTDKEAQIPDWNAAIAKYELPWLQYLDMGGGNAEKLSIGKYPTNFLLDSTGKIIRKDLDIPALAYFLSTRLK